MGFHRQLDFGNLLIGSRFGGFRLLFLFHSVGELLGRGFGINLRRLEGSLRGIDRVGVVLLFGLDFLERFSGIGKRFIGGSLGHFRGGDGGRSINQRLVGG